MTLRVPTASASFLSAATVALLYRMRLFLLFTASGSLLYWCGVWDMLNEVSIRSNGNDILWSMTPKSLLTRYEFNRRLLSSSSQYISNVDSRGALTHNTVSHNSSLTSSSVVTVYNDLTKNSINESDGNAASFYYSATFYYMEQRTQISTNSRHRVRRKHGMKQQRRRVAAAASNGDLIMPPLPPVNSSFIISGDKNRTTLSSNISRSLFTERPSKTNNNNSIGFYTDKRHRRLSSMDAPLAAAAAAKNGDNNFNDVVDERLDFVGAYHVSSSNDSSNKTLSADTGGRNPFLYLPVAADSAANSSRMVEFSGYSPTATTTTPQLQPLTLSLQPTPQPGTTQNYYHTSSTAAGATHPTIREPHNYDSSSKSTTRRSFYYLADNFGHAVQSGSTGSDDDSNSSSVLGDAMSAWWSKPMKLSSAVHVGDFPFMQFIISPQCVLAPNDAENVASSDDESTTKPSTSPAIVAASLEHATTVAASNIKDIRRPNCAAATDTLAEGELYRTGTRRVLVLVKSALLHFERRMVIRRTWASHPQLVVRFLIGRAPPAAVEASSDDDEFLAESNSNNDTDKTSSSWYMQFYEALSFPSADNETGAVLVDDTDGSHARAQRSAATEQANDDNVSNRTVAENCITAECNVTREHAQYDDIVLTDFVDNYYNNTFKTLSGIHWAAQSCRLGAIEYALLCDDDMWLNPYNLLVYLEDATRNDSISADRDLYMGYLFPNSKPMRIRWSKWYVPVSVYKFDRYPPYITASAILMSRSTLIKFAEASLHTEFFVYDDIFLAILARQLGINATHNHLFSSFNRVDVRDASDVFGELIVSHGYGVPLTLAHAWNVTICQRLFPPAHVRAAATLRRPPLTMLPPLSMWQWFFNSIMPTADEYAAGDDAVEPAVQQHGFVVPSHANYPLHRQRPTS